MEPSRTPSTSQARIVWRAFVEIENEDGTTSRKGVVSQHTVIGRSPNLPIMIDHDTVSRNHAELFCDPFGRWWIRDLESMNGTTVNGERVTERVLSPGDRIGIGDVRMLFRLGLDPDASRNATPQPRRAATSESPPPPRHASWMKTLSELASPQISASHLAMVMALNRKLLAEESSEKRLFLLSGLMVSEGFHGVMCAVLRVEGADSVEIVSGPHRPDHTSADGDLHVSRAVLAQVARTGEAVLGSNLPENAGPDIVKSSGGIPLATVASPLGHESESPLLLYVNLPPLYGRPEWLALIALAAEAYQQAEASWTARRHAQEHAAIERELETARQIQRALIPANLMFEGLDVTVGFEPCKWVGGDYVGVITGTNGSVLLAVADVCGKGLQPALVTFSLHTMLSALADSGRSVSEIMERLNGHLFSYMPEDSFVTMVCVSLDPNTGVIECVNAGHPPPLVFDERGNRRELQSAMNPALGLGRCEMVCERSTIADGELLLLYTDGITELRDPSGAMLGEEKLATHVAESHAREAKRPLPDIARDLTKMLDGYRGGELPADDRAFLLARRSRPA
jgi:serine phosphatase RsbU (regulator of sigma subunit)